MAETGTSTEDLLRLAQQLSQPDQAPPQQMQVARPSSVVGLLGSALGGGSSGNVGLTEEQANAEGRSALLNFGLNMLEGSGPSRRRRSLGQIFAGGVRGAQGAIGDYESQIAARQAAAAQMQQQQIENRFKGIEGATKLGELQQKLRSLQTVGGMTLDGKPASGDGEGGPDPVAGMSKEEARAAIIQRESGGQNIFSKIKVEGRTQEELGSGYYQIIPSTWREGAKLAGVDTSQYPLAINAPKAVQDKVFDALWDKYGAKPWAQSAPKAAPGGTTTKTAATTPPSTTAPPATPTGPIPLPPEPPSGMLPSPEAAPAPGNVARGPSGTQVAGPPGVVNMRAARPAGPEVQGDVEAIVKGMTARGADPDTLAAGPSPGGPAAQVAGPAGGPVSPKDAAAAKARATNTPQAVPGVDGLWAMPNGILTSQRPAGLPGGPAPAAEATPQPPEPKIIPQSATQQPAGDDGFVYKPSDLPDALKQYTTKELQPQQLKDLQARRSEARTAFDQAKSIGDTEGMRKARERLSATDKDEADLLQTQSKDVQEVVRQFYGKDFDAQRKDFENKQTHARALEIEGLKLKNATELEQTKTGLATGSKIMNDLNTQAVGAQKKIDDLDLLRVVSAGVDDDGLARKLSTMRWGDTTAANKIATWGLTSDDFKDKVGRINQLQAMINNTVTSMRQGMSMGPLSDRDLSFIQAMTPDLYQNKATRDGVIKLLREMSIRQSRFSNEVGRLWDDGKGMKIHDAINRASEKLEKENPIIPQVSDVDAADPTKFRDFVKKHKLEHGAIIRDEKGNLGTLEMGGR